MSRPSSSSSAPAAFEVFGSRWGLVLATLGMAVGTGNIWRFPRVVASNGGGSFLVAWVVFLLLWSIPLMMVEFSFGKRSRRGVVGAFVSLAGKRFAWMGGWIALCAVAIMFYYSVVAGWCMRFLAASLTGELSGGDGEAVWNGFAGTPAALVTHALALGVCVAVVWFGVRGIERVATVLIPTLFVLVVALAIRAVTLPGASAGLEFMFQPEWSQLADPAIWIQALTQNAWDTGAGWGLILSYAVYMKAREDVPLNAFLIGFGNNSVSLLSGIMVLCTVFAINPAAQEEIVGAGNSGLTFIWMPRLFAEMPGGAVFMVVFFLALSVAAVTSLVSMLELGTRMLVDWGFARRRAILWLAGAALVLGAPSALSVTFLDNQDWVWGIGLMLSGLFFALGARRFGLERLRREVVNAPGADLHVGRWWNFLITVVVPLEAVVLILWWLVAEASGDSIAAALNPLETFSAGTVLVQWAVVIVALLLLNRWLGRRLTTDGADPDRTLEETP